MYSGEYDVCDVTLIYPVWIYTQSNITNIIYLLLKNSKRVLIPKAEIEVYHNARRHTFSEMYTCRKFHI
jgi:hypothetical protein